MDWALPVCVTIKNKRMAEIIEKKLFINEMV